MFWRVCNQCSRLRIQVHRGLCRYTRSEGDYYKILGLERTATQREIKSAYYQLSKKYHPDVAGSNKEAAKKFQDISNAYDTLKDPEKRRTYDQYGSSQGQFYGANDPFSNYRQRAGGNPYGGNTYGGSPFGGPGGNPFHNKQFTQQEYERIWQEFNRMRNQREAADRRTDAERQRIWEEFARRRAGRWQEFHSRYPNGAPGSFRWEWKYTTGTPNNDMGVKQGVDLFKKIIMVYFVIFFVVTLVRVVLEETTRTSPKKDDLTAEIEKMSDKEKIEAYMREMPRDPRQQQQHHTTYQDVPHEFTPRSSKPLEEYVVNDAGTQFTMYRPSRSN